MPMRFSRLLPNNYPTSKRWLGCHPAANLFGFTFRVFTRHQSLQTTERTWHIPFACGEARTFFQKTRVPGFVYEIRPCTIYNLRPNFTGPEQQIRQCIPDFVFTKLSVLGNRALRARSSFDRIAHAF